MVVAISLYYIFNLFVQEMFYVVEEKPRLLPVMELHKLPSPRTMADALSSASRPQGFPRARTV